MEQILRIEVNDSEFSVLAGRAHDLNVSVNDYCRILLKRSLDDDELPGSENPEQMKMNFPEREAAEKNISDEPKEQASDITRPPFPKKPEKAKPVPAPVGNQQKTVGSWVDPKVANKPNSWLF
jgi:hypothetical protein